MTDSDSSPVPYATAKERYLNGLLKGPALSRRNVCIGYVDGRGRSAFAVKDFQPGDFVSMVQCEGSTRKEKLTRGKNEILSLAWAVTALMQHTKVSSTLLMLHPSVMTLAGINLSYISYVQYAILMCT